MRNKRDGSTLCTFMEFEAPGARELGHIGSTVSGNGRTNRGQHIPDLRHGGGRPRTTVSFREWLRQGLGMWLTPTLIGWLLDICFGHSWKKTSNREPKSVEKS